MASSESAETPQASTGQPMLARHRKDQTQNTPPQKTEYFPLSIKEGFSQWWAAVTPASAENAVLSYVPYLRKPPTHTQTGNAPVSANASTFEVDKNPLKEAVPVRTSSIEDPYGPRQWHSKLVELSGKNRFLNEFSVERLEEETHNNLVMLHGYGAGLGFYYKNFEPLSRRPNWKLYALDLLGMGRSSRPKFSISAKEREEKTREAESWFVDALEEWRIKRGIEKMTLLGHSLGGYMAVCYALKYPGHLDKLILASPVGFPEDPYAVNAELPEPSESTMASEFAQSQEETTRESINTTATKPAPRRPLPKWLVTLWDANVSPFSLVRMTGPLGPTLVSGWTSRRFNHLPAGEAQALHDYSYSLFRQRGSGEYALAYILAPGAFARSPLLRRIQGVGRQYLGPHSQPESDAAAISTQAVANKARETGIPVVWMYGDHDWMDANGGYDAAKKMDDERNKALANASEQEKLRENGSTKVTIIKKAGHHIYLDGPDQFNQEVLDEMEDVERRQKRLAAL